MNENNEYKIYRNKCFVIVFNLLILCGVYGLITLFTKHFEQFLLTGMFSILLYIMLKMIVLIEKLHRKINEIEKTQIEQNS